MKTLWTVLVLLLLTVGGGSPAIGAGESVTLHLQASAQVDSEGVFLAQVASPQPAVAMPQVRLCDAPPFGQAAMLSRIQVFALVQQLAPDLLVSNWAGADRIRIVRRSRPLNETEVREQLTALLQREYVRDQGELELRLSRPWTSVLIPDEPCAFKILDLPNLGVTRSFIVRFQVTAGPEVIGTWQASLQARVLREVWVARTLLKSGTLLSESEVSRERRDVLSLRESPLSLAPPEVALELAEMVPAGSTLMTRSVRPRPVVYRGQVVDAQFRDVGMSVTLKVEVMENGAPGQLIRVRNVQSKREFRGKVHNEQIIHVVM